MFDSYVVPGTTKDMSYLAKSLSRVQRIESQRVIGDFKGTFSEVNRGCTDSHLLMKRAVFFLYTNTWFKDTWSWPETACPFKLSAYNSVISLIIKSNDYYCLKKILNALAGITFLCLNIASVSAGHLF